MKTASFIALFFMTDSSIHRLKKIAIGFLVALWAQPVFASSVEIVRWSTQCERVTLRVRVIDDNNVPIQGLRAKDFQIKTTGARGQQITLRSSQINFLSSQQSQPDPAYLVMLLDMSGSMRHKDLAGKKKQEEAVKAIREVIRDIRAENMPVQIALIPFGEKGKNCTQGFKVDVDEISQKLVKVTDNQLDEQLNYLAGIEVCAATKIYEPLAETVKFLGESNFESSRNDIIGKPLPPRLAVILLSDGYDVVRSNERERFQNLIDVLHQYPQVTVHTMGYGETLRQLHDRANCSLTDSKLTVDNVSSRCRLPKQDINEFIVDENRLNEIAQLTGGIYRLPGNAEEVVETLRTFLTTLREYEITYRQPGSDRASLHQTTVGVILPSRQIDLTAETKTIRMSNFNYCPLSLSNRFSILALTLVLLGVPSLLLFIAWSKKLKSQAERLLQNHPSNQRG